MIERSTFLFFLQSVVTGLACVLFSFLSLNAQERSIEQLDQKNFYYDREWDFEMRLHSNGFAAGLNWGQNRTYYKTVFWHTDIGFLRHNKEFRQSNNPPLAGLGETSKAFVYGKQNNLYVLRVGRGLRYLFGEKSREKGVRISFQGEIGPSLGILRPYYLRVFSNDIQGALNDIKYSEETETEFLDRNQIFGGTGLFNGWNEISLRPGIQGRLGTQFEWSQGDDGISMADFGIMFDYFFNKVPIMIIDENQSLFINVYLALRLGKKS